MLNILRFIRLCIARYSFSKNSKRGLNFKCGDSAKCYSEKKGRISIGDNCDIQGVLVSQDEGLIEIGSYTTIRPNSIIGSVCKIAIGNNVIISNFVHIYDNNNHPTSPEIRYKMTRDGFYGKDWKWKNSDSKAIVIKNNVWIGERSTILKGVTIGEGSIVACNAVVTKDVPSFSIVAGNPAKVVKILK